VVEGELGIAIYVVVEGLNDPARREGGVCLSDIRLLTRLEVSNFIREFKGAQLKDRQYNRSQLGSPDEGQEEW
jgi:hypothetical protein